MRTTIDKAERLVSPKALRDRVGLGPGEVEVIVDGTGLRVEPLAGEDLAERDGRLLIRPEVPRSTTRLSGHCAMPTSARSAVCLVDLRPHAAAPPARRTPAVVSRLLTSNFPYSRFLSAERTAALETYRELSTNVEAIH
jgi:bifunctional DNA-binding transcriptional regulator/antitoxin component of YhaV-PrlF toxin-antitoxin module